MLTPQLPPQPDKIEMVQPYHATTQSGLNSPSLKRLIKRTDPDTGKYQTILIVEGKHPSVLITEEEVKKWLIDLGDFSNSLDMSQKKLALSLTQLDQDNAKILNHMDSRLTEVEELTNFINDDQLKMQSQLDEYQSERDEYDDQFVAIFEDQEKIKFSLVTIQQTTHQRLSALEEKFSAVNTPQKSAATSSLEEHNTTTPPLRSSEITEYIAAQAAITERLNALERQFKGVESLEQLLHQMNQAKTAKESHRKTKLQQMAHLERRVAVLTWLGRGGILFSILAYTWWICVHKR
jgi:hypothetical protein